MLQKYDRMHCHGQWSMSGSGLYCTSNILLHSFRSSNENEIEIPTYSFKKQKERGGFIFLTKIKENNEGTIVLENQHK